MWFIMCNPFDLPHFFQRIFWKNEQITWRTFLTAIQTFGKSWGPKISMYIKREVLKKGGLSKSSLSKFFPFTGKFMNHSFKNWESQGWLFYRWGASFLSGVCAPWGASVLMGGSFEKNRRMGGTPQCPPLWETLQPHKNYKLHESWNPSSQVIINAELHIGLVKLCWVWRFLL